MENKKNNKSQNNKNPTIKEKNGLRIEYNKGKLNNEFPNLMKELNNNEFLKINSFEINQDKKDNINNSNEDTRLPLELINPGAIDFIRRCKNDEQAIEILEYLLNRKEISKLEYNAFKKQILKEGGLTELINNNGGPKDPGYYLKKYYKRSITSDTLDHNR